MNATLTVTCPGCGCKTRLAVSADNQRAININLESPYCEACDEADLEYIEGELDPIEHVLYMRD